LRITTVNYVDFYPLISGYYTKTGKNAAEFRINPNYYVG